MEKQCGLKRFNKNLKPDKSSLSPQNYDMAHLIAAFALFLGLSACEHERERRFAKNVQLLNDANKLNKCYKIMVNVLLV